MNKQFYTVQNWTEHDLIDWIYSFMVKVLEVEFTIITFVMVYKQVVTVNDY